MKITILAEKPSVAREIAAIVGATDKQDGYIQGNNYFVTWAFGHLVGLAMPEEYGAKGFNRNHLPIVPETFILKPRQVRAEKGYKDDSGALKQLNVIKNLFNKSDQIIVATDAGREGELIFRYIYHYLQCTKPFSRLWISSLTEKAIREGLDNLKQGKDYNDLYQAAKARSEADWLVGINASQALSIAAGQGTYSLGRVQTPTLAMICKRYQENKNFVSTPFWQLRINTEKASVNFSAISREKFEDKQRVEELFRLLQSESNIQVVSVDCKEVNQEPPLLYDLTTLQKEANNKHGFSADKTLSIAQKLYESKLVTYPRTGSRYLSDDVFDTLPELFKSLYTHPVFGTYAKTLTNLNTRSLDNKKITDHHAIIITENLANGLSNDDKVIYDMIAGRLLETVSPKCIKDSTTLILSCSEIEFITKGSVIKQIGWRMVFEDKEETEEEDNPTLPKIENNDILPLLNPELLEKQTKAKPLHTEASLLSAMETAGKDLEDEDQRKAMKESGIGTPATRAAIIETLFARNYIRREKKNLIPTENGLQVFEVVKDKRISDVQMTGMWEDAFSKIESGKTDADNFKKGIEVFASQVTEELLNAKFTLLQHNSCLCPKCKEKPIRFYPMLVRCTDPDCGFVLYRKRNEKILSDKQLISLMTIGKTELIKGLKSRAGNIFDAIMTFDADFNIKYLLPDNKKKKK